VTIDISEQLGLVRREVIERQHLGRPARVVVATREAPAEGDAS